MEQRESRRRDRNLAKTLQYDEMNTRLWIMRGDMGVEKTDE
jgi:hypothetical protein